MTSQSSMQTGEQDKPASAIVAVVLGLGLSIIAVPLTGCDSSMAVKNIPEESKKTLIQRKVDVTPGKAKSSRAGSSITKDRASGQKR